MTPEFYEKRINCLVESIARSSDSPSYLNELHKKISKLDFAHSGLKKVEKALQLLEAESYLYKRAFDNNYKTRFTFFCFHLNFGFSKFEKVTAVRALIRYLKDNVPIPESCKPALSQGELGKIAALYAIEYETVKIEKGKRLH
jgi:hypothetical protein